MIDQHSLLGEFRRRFGRPAVVVGRAPGRVNLIGEHTDYNGGFVLPAAINREVAIALARRSDNRIRLYSLDFQQTDEIEDALGSGGTRQPLGWPNYVVAVVRELQARGVGLSGFDAAITGDVPVGAGLSSSAALEMATGIGLQGLFGFPILARDLALLGQAAEHSPLVGVNCGIMDQFISALGQADHALFIDCHTLEFRSVPLPGTQASILIVNSMVQRGLADSEYNQRRAQCAEGLALLSTYEHREFPSLRHAGLEVFQRHTDRLPEPVRRRLRHVLTENVRVCQAVDALRSGDFVGVGRLFAHSHASLRDDYQVSCPALDLLCELLQEHNGVYGARMTGAGFGGCIVGLVRPEAAAVVAAEVAERYARKTGKHPDTFVTPACEGAHFINLVVRS